MVDLHCLFSGDDFSKAVCIEIGNDQSIARLRVLAKDLLPSGLRDLDIRFLDTYNIPPIRAGDDTTLQGFYQRIAQADVSVPKAEALATIREAFPSTPTGYIHAIFGVSDDPDGPSGQGYRELYDELWGKSEEFSGIQEVNHKVPRPQFYLEPGYGFRMKQARLRDFPLTGISPQSRDMVMKELRTKNRMPGGIKSLLVRSEYERIETVLEDAVRRKWSRISTSGGPIPSARLDYKVSGQPGSGKSYLLSYLLVRRLLKCEPTVFRSSDRRCFLFNAQSRGRLVDVTFLSCLADRVKRDLWILTDGVLEEPEWCEQDAPWFTVLAASPKKVGGSRQWSKERNVGVHYMKNWEWPEIFAAFCMENPGVRKTEIETLYTTFVCFGPVARTCLRAIPARAEELEYDSALAGYLDDIDREITDFVRDGGKDLQYTVSQSSSHRIALMDPNEMCNGYTSIIATRWIAHRMAAAIKKGSDHHFYEFFRHLSRHETLRTAAGWFFEAYGHDWLRNGGKFLADELPADGAKSTLEFSTKRTATEVSYFTNARNLATEIRKGRGSRGVDTSKLQIYFEPYSKTQESFDGVVFDATGEVILLQYTIADRHPIKANGIDLLLRALPATIKCAHIVFVVPEDRADDYSNAQTVLGAEDLKWKGQLKQYRLVFPDATIRKVAIGGDSLKSGGGAMSGGSPMESTKGISGGSQHSQGTGEGTHVMSGHQDGAAGGLARDNTAHRGAGQVKIGSGESSSGGAVSGEGSDSGGTGNGQGSSGEAIRSSGSRRGVGRGEAARRQSPPRGVGRGEGASSSRGSHGKSDPGEGSHRGVFGGWSGFRGRTGR